MKAKERGLVQASPPSQTAINPGLKIVSSLFRPSPITFTLRIQRAIELDFEVRAPMQHDVSSRTCKHISGRRRRA